MAKFGLGVVVTAIGLAGMAYGDTLPPSYSSAQVGCLADTPTCPPALSGYGVPSLDDYVSDGATTADAKVNATGNSISDMASEQGPYGTTAASELQYYYEITGPSPEVAVDIQALLTSTGGATSGYWAAGGALYLGGTDLGPFYTCEDNDEYCNGVYNETVNVDTTVLIPTNSRFEITLDAFAQVSEGTANAQTIVDPTFAIDSSVVDASAYTIEFSPGVGNGLAPVPEPRTLAILAAALAAVLIARKQAARNIQSPR